MKILDHLRQLYLLLWKNFILRRRKKIRIIVEILWPLFLFLILMWVRTRGLRAFENQCHFAEKPLPSSGILPFIRGYVCELNFSCSSSPRDTYYDQDFFQLTELTSDSLNVLNQEQTLQSITTIVTFLNSVLRQRNLAQQITSKMTLSESLKISESQFQSKLISNSLYPSPLNENFLNMSLKSNPNFNYLYSNFTTDYQDPISFFTLPLILLSPSKSLINIFYGPDLDNIDMNRRTNQVYNSTWIRSQMCFNNTNLLLRGTFSQDLKTSICNLNDTQISSLFILISSDLDYSKVRKKVFDNTLISNSSFINQAINALDAYRKLQKIFQNSSLFSNNGTNSLEALMNKFQNSDFTKTLCKGSKLSLFDIIGAINIDQYNWNGFSQLLKNITNNVTSISRLSKLISNDFEFSSKAWQSTENYGRLRSFKIDKKNNPFVDKAGSTFTTKATTNQTTNNSSDNPYEFATEFFTSFNNLNKLNSTQCPAKRTDADLDSSTNFLVNSTTKSCFCQTIYAIINGLSQDTRILFSQIKPLFLGKILYAPNTPTYQKLIKRVNSTFTNMDRIVQMIGNFGDLGSKLLQQLNSTTDEINQLQDLIERNMKELGLNITMNSIDIKKLTNQLKYITSLFYFIRNSLQCFELNKFIGFPSEEKAVQAGTALINKEAFWATIVFNNPEEISESGEAKLPKIVSYKIRMNASQTHDTVYTQDRTYNYGPTNCLGCNSYYLFGFIYIQDMLEKGIIEVKTNTTQDFGIIGQMMPYPNYINDKFITAIARTLPLFMVLAWIYTVSMMVKDIVYEKEKRLKEFMRVMGLTNGMHWLSWFITSFITMFFIIFLLCIIIKYGKITTYSNLGALIVFFTCFTLATITQCFLISVFFNKANLAAVVSGIIYFLLYLPYTILVNYSDIILPWQKFLASLSSTVAFSYGCELISSFEQQAIGLQWSNFYTTPYSTKDDFSMNNICLILLLDSVIYMILTWYIEGIAPGEYGIPRKWYFPVQPSYWCGESVKIKPNKNNNRNSSIFSKLEGYCCYFSNSKEKLIREEELLEENNNKRLKNLDESIEKPPQEILETPGIQIQRLHKVYSRGNNHALKGLTVNFYKNEISAFLGHNGAGKSTTMHLLTGLYSPTSGTAKIDGLDITQSMDTIRKSLGFVPQHNVLFPGMTVKEHLWFYARLKGLDRKSTLQETEKMLDDTGLRPKKNELSKNLSGGMQRKLSVAIAFVGGSKTVILDEPSAGVDPAGRRSIWDLLFKYRSSRTIIISTHHMDEADVLGDRIAIISNGKLIAHGTSYFLKNKFGKGYYLTFAKKILDNDEVLDTPSDDLRFSSDSSSSSTDSGARSLSSFSDSNQHSTASAQNKQQTYAFNNANKRMANDILDEEEVDLEDFEDAQIKNEQNILKDLKTQQDINLCNFVKNKIPNAILVENIGSEMTFSISNKPEFTRTYEKFFQQVEQNMPRLGIDSIGISDTTLEEIFIKLAKQPKSNSFKTSGFSIFGFDLSKIKETICSCTCKKPPLKLTSEQIEEYSSYTKLRIRNKFLIVMQQLYALLTKRLHRVKRNIKGFIAEIVLPVIFVCLALLVATLSPKVADRPSLELHPWYYSSPNNIFLSKSSSINYDNTFYFTENSSISVFTNPDVQSNIDTVNGVANAILKSPGLGTRCMKGHKIIITQSAEDYSRSFGSQELSCENFENNMLNNFSLPRNSFIKELLSTNYTYSKKSLDCDSTQGFPECPESAGGDILYRNIYKLKTTDIIYDLSGRNVTDWLIKTEFNKQFFRKRFGGYEFMSPYVNVNNEYAENLILNLQQFTSSINNLLDQLNQTVNNLGLNNTNSDVSFNNSDLVGSNPLISNQNVKLWYNTKGYDSNVAYLNALNNAILRSKINEINKLNKNNPKNLMDPTEHGIVAYNHPMPFTRAQFISQIEKRVLIDLFVAVCIIFALSFIPASFLVFLLEERENNSKQLQFVSGVKPYIYWISNFIWDLINYIVPCALCIIIFIIFDVKAYMSKENFPCLIALMLLYGWSCIPLMYPLNYIFKIPSTAFVISSSLNVFIGVISTMTTTVLSQLGEEEPDLLKVNNILKPVFVSLFPHYCLGQGFIEMARLYNDAEIRRAFGYKVQYDPFRFDSAGRNLLAMAIQGVVYFTINLLIQYKFFVRFKPTGDIKKLNLPPILNEDDDVLNEKNRILQNESESKLNNKRFLNSIMNKIRNNSDNKIDVQLKKVKKIDENDLNQDYKDNLEETEFDQSDKDYIKLINLTKIYKRFKKCTFKKHVAVNNLSIGINKGECFGLIGVNGAGKTTTFKMITGEIPITCGDVYVNGYSVSRQIEKVHRNIGYCPQSDAIIPLLTAREHLIFFARLRGIPEAYVEKVSEWAMHRVGLNVFADRISGDFSGGNKRKLSTAIALVGNPSVICLDEPTSGMDAKARRLLWNDIISLIKENRIVILTSHSMEECEALCTRLVIMVNGQFKCLGSSQHLKSKFGNGYKLSIRLNDENKKNELFDFMKQNFPTSVIQETHRNLFEYVLPFTDTRLSEIFGKIENNRENLDIKDYSVSQTTLDQVFINFAKSQNEEPFSDPITTNQSNKDINMIEKGTPQPSEINKSQINTKNKDSFDNHTQSFSSLNKNNQNDSNNNLQTSQNNIKEELSYDSNNNLAIRKNSIDFKPENLDFNILPKTEDRISNISNQIKVQSPISYETSHL